MSKVLVNKSTLISIADAIREKSGTADTYKPAEMSKAISAIMVSGEDVLKGIIGNWNYSNLTTSQAQQMLDIIGETDALRKQVGEGMFKRQDNITSVTIPNGIKYIGAECFRGCLKLANVSFPESLTELADKAFYSTNISTVKLPASLTKIGADCFIASNVKKVYFNGTPTFVSPTAFAENNALTDIYVPWAEGAVSYAPWGATNATIHYNYTE